MTALNETEDKVIVALKLGYKFFNNYSFYAILKIWNIRFEHKNVINELANAFGKIH